MPRPPIRCAIRALVLTVLLWPCVVLPAGAAALGVQIATNECATVGPYQVCAGNDGGHPWLYVWST